MVREVLEVLESSVASRYSIAVLRQGLDSIRDSIRGLVDLHRVRRVDLPRRAERRVSSREVLVPSIRHVLGLRPAAALVARADVRDLGHRALVGLARLVRVALEPHLVERRRLRQAVPCATRRRRAVDASSSIRRRRKAR